MLWYDGVILSCQGNFREKSLPELTGRLSAAAGRSLRWPLPRQTAEKAHELVVENSNKIAAEIDDNIRPVKDKLYPPHMKGAEQEIQDRTWNTARKWYGDPLPQLVQDRIELELNSIVKNGFSVHYLIAQRLVAKSNKDGYLVGSRGSG